MFSKLVNKVGSEQGLSMMEVLVIMFTFALISMAVANSAMTGLRSYKFVSLKAAADALAQSKMEQWAAQNPSDLDATDNVTNQL
jgi:Tfp pilus assembly protein PilV